ncbi:16S rRNA (cytosine(1402)-N(4))-methyltransferase [Candidatus Dependentiae bacterium]|nr:MAG: 16S rRNA (cytosine(1402)-N(4))-methyltransferase [Candidatus Dependentiae bacterium]
MNEQETPFIHRTVLLQEAIDALNIKPNSTIVDATFGGGGHTRALLEQHPTIKVIALDWDTAAIKKNSSELLEEFGDRLTITWANFANIYRVLKKAGIKRVDGILADLGTSQFQIKHKDGFSFSVDTPLDMRMSNAHSYVTAASFLAHKSEKDLTNIFFKYGEEKKSKRIAQAIVEARSKRRIVTTGDLTDIILSVVPNIQYKNGKRQIHPATRVFQALRIAVNHELEHIETFLKAVPEVLASEGRLVVISFHSLEDRIIKTFIQEKHTVLKNLTKKPIGPSEDERYYNPSSRSSKMRIAEML